MSHQINVNLAGFAITGALTISGDGSSTTNTNVYASVDSIPSLLNTIVNNLGNLFLINEANGLGYVPSNVAKWNSVQPINVQNALDRIANQIGLIP